MKKKLQFVSYYLKNLMQLLNQRNEKSRLIGGCVRDAMLNKPIKDIDLATTIEPNQVIQILTENRIKVIPSGIKYGTVTAIINTEKFEITTLRKDLKCDGRWAEIEFSKDFEQDALRRDFTINAMSYCIIEEKLFDYFGGLNDLVNKKVVFINDPEQRIQEDYLRILRFFRFSSYYSNALDPDSLAACNKNAHFLSKLSRERINSEFDKILISPELLNILDAMQPYILRHIFPDLTLACDIMPTVLKIQQVLNIKLNVNQMYGLILHKNSRANLAKLKFSNIRIKTIQNFIKYNLHTSKDAIFHIKSCWIENTDTQSTILIELLNKRINLDIAKSWLNTIQNNPAPKFPIHGDLIKKLGYSGQDIGNVLDYLKGVWINSDFTIDKTKLLECLKNY